MTIGIVPAFGNRQIVDASKKVILPITGMLLGYQVEGYDVALVHIPIGLSVFYHALVTFADINLVVVKTICYFCIFNYYGNKIENST